MARSARTSLRQPLRQRGGARIASSTPRPSPVGGWNARDADAAMPSTDARLLLNWFPRQNDLVSRKGYALISDTGTGQRVEHVFAYDYANSRSLLAATNGELHRITGIGASTAVATGMLNTTDWHADMMSSRLILVNGVDAPVYYDGTAIAAAGFTGVGLTPSDLNFAFAFKSRMYFIKKNSQEFWYGGVSAVTGPLQKFDLSLTGSFEGNLMILTAITYDGGSSKENLFVAIFDSGDVVVYSGSDPGGTDWALAGKYKIGRPLSKWAIRSNGVDILIVTERGYESLAPSLKQGEVLRNMDMASDKIQQAVSDRIVAVGVNNQWRIGIHQLGQFRFVQVPATAPSTPNVMHVQNINTKAWTQFVAIPSVAWCSHNGKLYFGSSDGKVHEFWVGNTDDGKAIKLEAWTAWDALSPRGNKKQLNFEKFILKGSKFPTIYVQVAKDFDAFIYRTFFQITTADQPAYFDQDYWNKAYWSSGTRTKEYLHKHGAIGFSFSARIVATGTSTELSWNSTTFYSESGDII